VLEASHGTFDEVSWAQLSRGQQRQHGRLNAGHSGNARMIGGMRREVKARNPSLLE
jgi:hypothetical protein